MHFYLCARSFRSIHSPSPTYIRASKCGAYFQNTLGLAVLPCPAQSGGLPQPLSLLGKCGDVTSQVVRHRDHRRPWFFVTLIRIPDEPQCLAYFVTKRTFLVAQRHPPKVTVYLYDGVLQRRIRNYPYSRLACSRSIVEWQKKGWGNAASFKRIDWQGI